MRASALLLSLSLLLSLALVGCGDGNSSGGNDGGNPDLDGGTDSSVDDGGEDAGPDAGPEVPEDIAAVVAQGLCEFAAECDTGYDEGTFFVFRYYYSNCEAVVPQNLEYLGLSAVLDLQRAVDAGTVTVDYNALAACLADVGANCTYSPMVGIPCLDLFEGTADLGDSCLRHEECAGDAYCAYEEACPGTCAEQVDVGDPCNVSEQCDKGSYDAAVCSEGTCFGITFEPGNEVGDDCGRRPIDTPNEGTYAFCEAGTFCDNETEKCVAIAGPSEACTSPIGCVPGYSCEGVEVSQCEPVAFGQLGDPCGGDGDLTCDTYARLVCDEEAGECVSAGAGVDGDPCDLGAPEEEQCAFGFFCSLEGEVSLCRPLIENGDACSLNEQCVSGVCDGVCIEYCAAYIL